MVTFQPPSILAAVLVDMFLLCSDLLTLSIIDSKLCKNSSIHKYEQLTNGIIFLKRNILAPPPLGALCKSVLRILSFLGNLRSENIEMLNENSQIRIIRCLKYFLAPIEATDTTVRSAKVCIGP